MSRQKGYYVKFSYENDFVTAMQDAMKLYGQDIFQVQGIAHKHLDIAQFSKQFFGKSSNVADVSVDSNANVKQRNISQYNFQINKSIMRLNGLYLMYTNIKKQFSQQLAYETLMSVINGQIFINDLNLYSNPYCYGFDLRTLMMDGMSFFKGNMKIKPPKHSNSFIDLFIQTNAYISNQIAGASSYPDFFVLLDWFYRKQFGQDYINNFKTDNDIDSYIIQQFQNVTYSLNFPYRGGQSSFTNVSVLDKGFMEGLFTGYIYPMDSSKPNFDSVIQLSKYYFQYYSKINSEQGIFTFPVVTLAVSIDQNNEYIDEDFARWVAEQNSGKALANVFMGPSTVFSSCCRLANDFSKVADTGFQNSFGVGGLSIGSHRVCGINLARLGFLQSINNDTTGQLLNSLLQKVHAVLYSHRLLIKQRISQGVLPLYTHNWMSLNRQYSTIGLIGAYQYVTNKGLDMMSEQGMDSLKFILKNIQNRIVQWQSQQVEQKAIYNIQQIPGQTVAIRVCKCDSILGYNPIEFQLYSNQYLPLISDDSIYDRLKLQGEFDNFTSGGAICHINVDDDKPLTPNQFYQLMQSAKKLKVRYWAINYAFSECEEGHFSIGKDDICPVCQKQIINKYTRVVGFLTPVKGWSKVRRQFQFPNRKFYKNGQLKIENIEQKG